MDARYVERKGATVDKNVIDKELEARRRVDPELDHVQPARSCGVRHERD